jgi:hypothetical protein
MLGQAIKSKAGRSTGLVTLVAKGIVQHRLKGLLERYSVDKNEKQEKLRSNGKRKTFAIRFSILVLEKLILA